MLRGADGRNRDDARSAAGAPSQPTVDAPPEPLAAWRLGVRDGHRVARRGARAGDGHAGEQLADDAVGDERGDVARADAVGQDLDHVGATRSTCAPISRAAHSRSAEVIPPGSGVPVPGA